MADKLTKQQQQWQRENDAITLANAQEIKNDPVRFKNAQTAASKMAAEQEKHTNALKSVAGKTT